MNLLICLLTLLPMIRANWDHWWTYDGISGPAYWGLINPAWTMCNKGRRQSPINIDTSFLVYDNTLSSVLVDKQPINGRITNTGQSLVYRVKEGQLAINITGGPLAYKYQFQEIYFHWGDSDKSGSEHTVNHNQFAAELQIYGFNAQLYSNLSVAKEFPGGVVALSVLIHIKDGFKKEKSGLEDIISHLSGVIYRGGSTKVGSLSLASILPRTNEYITYEGSTTFPGCWETTTWIVYNRPIYISKHDLEQFQRLKQGDRLQEKAPLGNNLRPQQPLNSRGLRTNIALDSQKVEKSECLDPSTIMKYESSSWINKHSTLLN